MSSNKRILVAPLDWGLGHISRCIPLIEKLLENNHTVITCGNNESKQLFKEHFPKLQHVLISGYNAKYSKRNNQALSMIIQTPNVATDKLKKPENYLTFFGKFLRKSSLDELPQLYSVLVGDMTIVGPRPALYNQHELIKLRTQYSIHILKPGITGYAQINGRDEVSINKKVRLDRFYLMNKSFALDIKIITITFAAIVSSRNVKH